MPNFILWRIRYFKRVAELKYFFKHEIPEKFYIWLAWRLPKELAKWVFVRVATYKEMGNPGETKCLDALNRWSKDHA